MSEDKNAEAGAGSAEAGKASTAGGGLAAKLPLLLVLVNIIAMGGAIGLFIYTKMVFKRPQITEDGERKRLAQAKQTYLKTADNFGVIPFEPLTVNIKSGESNTKTVDGHNTAPDRLHYLNTTFTVEVRDIARKDDIEQLKPLIMDGIISAVGRMDVADLTSVQGRYLLRTKIIDLVNGLIAKNTQKKEPLATNVYFTSFMVQ